MSSNYLSPSQHKGELLRAHLAGPVFALCMLTQDFTMMVAMLALTSFLVGFHLGPIFAIAQTVAKPCARSPPH